VDPQVPRRRKSRAQFKQIRNRRNRRARKEVLDIINRLLVQVTKSLANPPPVFPSPSSQHIFSLISKKKFPSPSRYDPVYLFPYPLLYPHLLQSTIHLPLFHHAYFPMFLPYLSRLLPYLVWNFWAKSQLPLLPSSPTILKNSLLSPLPSISLNLLILPLQER